MESKRTLYRVIVPCKALRGMSREERLFLVHAMNALHELYCAHKLLLVAGRPSQEPVKKTGQAVQGLFLIRLLIGKVWETWKMVRLKFCRSGLSATYWNRLSVRAQDAFTQLKTYLKRDQNPMRRIRNRFAFHYLGDDEVEEQLATLDDAEPFEVYVAEHQGNALFAIPHVLMTMAMLSEMGEQDDKAAMDSLLNAAVTLAGHLIDFLNDCIEKILGSHVSLQGEKLQIEAPALDSLQMPFFVTRPRDWEG